MADPIYIHRYELHSRERLNLRSTRRSHAGVLVRIGDGFGCLHPWPELGDRPLEEQLQLLGQGRTTPLLEQTLECCRIDGEFREQGKNAFEGVEIPRSHFTMPQDWGDDELSSGFQTVKMKSGTGVGEVMKRASRVLESTPDMRFRLDYNFAFREIEELEIWWELMVGLTEKIDFLEDPLPFSESVWQELKQRLPQFRYALDRSFEETDVPEVRVIKPALQNRQWACLNVADHQQVVFTSYMDHPLGQVWAAWNAASLVPFFKEQLIDCGLVTHHLFHDADPFVAAMGPVEPVLTPPEGTGFGFDALLENLPWERLKTA